MSNFSQYYYAINISYLSLLSNEETIQVASEEWVASENDGLELED